MPNVLGEATDKKWMTHRDNNIVMNHPGFGDASYRIVWDEDSRIDVAYVLPHDGDNGNKFARLIQRAPAMRNYLDFIRQAIRGGTFEPDQAVEMIDALLEVTPR